MHSNNGASPLLKLLAWCGLALLHLPLLVIALYAFNTESAAFSFPLQGFTLQWFGMALSRPDVLAAIGLSLQVAALATLLAMILGTLAALAIWRHSFFGRDGISMLLVLPMPAFVLALLDAWTDEIAQGLAGMVHIFNPQLILIGGGVSAQQKLLIDPIAAKVKAAIMPAFAEGLEVRAAQLHNDAGMVGAVYYFRQTMEEKE